MAFPAGTEATIRQPARGTYVYTILHASAKQTNPGMLELHLSIRLTDNDTYDANFWDRSFRLLVDGVSRAPVSNLNDVVSGRSSGEGMIVFSLPTTLRKLVLLVGDSDPVKLPLTVHKL